MADNNNQSNGNGNDKAITPYLELKRLAFSDLDTLKRFTNAFGGNEQRARSFLSSVLTVVAMDNSLRQCEPNAILNECMRAAVLGLPINKELNLACIIAYNEKQKDEKGATVYRMVPHFQIMKQGYIELAHQTEEYLKINTNKIYEGQKPVFDQVTGDFHIEGEEDINKPITHYFNYFLLKNGFSHVICMSIDKLNAWGKKYSKSYDSPYGLWQTNPPVMYEKTVTKLNLKKYGKLIKDSGANKEEREKALVDDDEYRDPANIITPSDFEDQRLDPNIIDATFSDVPLEPETVTPAPAFVEDQTPQPAAEPEKAKAKKQDKTHDDSDLLIIELAKEGIAPDELAAADVVKKLKLSSSLPIEEAKKIVRGWYGWKDWGASDDQAMKYLNEGKYPK
jgi:phage RecT family recombinase